MTYFHQCKNNLCGKTFWGRKNKLFCDISCKAAFNNQRAADFRKELLDNATMQKAYFLLKVFHKLDEGVEPTPLDYLLEQGFSLDAPARIFRTLINNFEYRIIHGYGYRFTDKSRKYIMINSLKETEKL
jgi:hypothetical protein